MLANEVGAGAPQPAGIGGSLPSRRDAMTIAWPQTPARNSRRNAGRASGSSTRAQLLAEALLDAPLELLAAQRRRRRALAHLGVRLLGDEALELEQLGVVEIELVEVAVDDLLTSPVTRSSSSFAGRRRTNRTRRRATRSG
jgi:hypothetical protein